MLEVRSPEYPDAPTVEDHTFRIRAAIVVASTTLQGNGNGSSITRIHASRRLLQAAKELEFLGIEPKVYGLSETYLNQIRGEAQKHA